MLAAITFTTWYSDLQINGVKTNRQSLHPTDSFALRNHVAAPALRTNVELVQWLDLHPHSTTAFDLRPGATVAPRNAKHLMQQCLFH
jgi:hypothetical protein